MDVHLPVFVLSSIFFYGSHSAHFSVSSEARCLRAGNAHSAYLGPPEEKWGESRAEIFEGSFLMGFLMGPPGKFDG